MGNNNAKKRIVFVVQRYGAEINGGAEQHTRRIAERLVNKYDVEVVTSTAINVSWTPFYREGTTELNGVKISRFDSICPRNRKRDVSYREALRDASEQTREIDEKLVDSWLNDTGFVSPKMLRYIEGQKESTNLFLFMTYLYFHSIRGLPLVAEKAAFFPTAHDESYIYYPIFDRIFNLPRFLLFNSIEECQLVHGLFRNQHIPYKVVGEGVDTPKQVFPEKFKAKFGLNNYIIYVGRIGNGTAKRCNILMEYFERFKQTYPSDLKLVLVGRPEVPLPARPDIIFTGFITDQEKFDAMAGARLLAMPSQNESLCMAVLEALSVQTPVLVDADCAVTKGHCLRSNAGLYYRNYLEFQQCLQYILEHESIAKQMGKNGKKYVEQNYNWDLTLNYIDEIMKGM